MAARMRGAVRGLGEGLKAGGGYRTVADVIEKIAINQ
jgi:hypothetical protein